MFDIKWIRENPDAFDEGLARRGLNAMAPELIEGTGGGVLVEPDAELVGKDPGVLGTATLRLDELEVTVRLRIVLCADKQHVLKVFGIDPWFESSNPCCGLTACLM